MINVIVCITIGSIAYSIFGIWAIIIPTAFWCIGEAYKVISA